MFQLVIKDLKTLLDLQLKFRASTKFGNIYKYFSKIVKSIINIRFYLKSVLHDMIF